MAENQTTQLFLDSLGEAYNYIVRVTEFQERLFSFAAIKTGYRSMHFKNAISDVVLEVLYKEIERKLNETKE